MEEVNKGININQQGEMEILETPVQFYVAWVETSEFDIYEYEGAIGLWLS